MLFTILTVHLHTKVQHDRKKEIYGIVPTGRFTQFLAGA